MDIRICDHTRLVDEDAYLRDFIRAVEHKDMDYIKFVVPIIEDQKKSVYQSLDQCGNYLKLSEEDGSRYDFILSHGLLLAAHHGSEEIAEYLLSHGADVNAQNSAGDTPLIKACERGYNSIVTLLLRNGADINRTNLVGYTALQWVSRLTERSDTVNLLLQCHAVDVNLTSHKRGRSALHFAAENDVSGVNTKLLLDKLAYVNSKDKEGMTPLHLAAQRGHYNNVKLLLEYGAYPNIQNTQFGYSAVHYAMKEGHVEVTELLLKCGANPLLKDKHDLTALQNMIRYSKVAGDADSYKAIEKYIQGHLKTVADSELARMKKMFVVICEVIPEERWTSLFTELLGEDELDEYITTIPLRTSDVSLSVLLQHLLHCWLDNYKLTATFWVLMRALVDHNMKDIADQMVAEFWD